MMNGIEYLPFKCYKNNGINGDNCSLINFGNIMKNVSCYQVAIMRQILCNLFEQMFESSP